MDVSGALHTLRKHWILTSVLVLLTLVAAMGAWTKISGPYQSSSQVVFLASEQTSKPNGNNPYLSFDDTLSTTADIVRRHVEDFPAILPPEWHGSAPARYLPLFGESGKCRDVHFGSPCFQRNVGDPMAVRRDPKLGFFKWRVEDCLRFAFAGTFQHG